MIRRMICWLTLSALIAGPAAADKAREIKNLTRARTRMVWAQQQDGYGDYQAETADFKLMGFDTDDGGERVILDEVDCYGFPLLNHDATRIIYTDRAEGNVYTVNWDGTGKALFKQGFASDIWLNRTDSTEWVVAKPWEGEDVPVCLYNIDDAADSVLVWNLTPVGHGTPFLMQLSNDGTHASGTFPWNGGGLAVLPNGGWTKYADGCQPSISPNDDYMAWVGTLRHRSFVLFDSTGTQISEVDVHVGREIRGWEVFHIKWCGNNVRFMTRTGPYSDNSTGYCPTSDCGNLIEEGGTNVEFYVCRFDAGITEIEEYVTVTGNEKADFFGDCWIDPGPHAKGLGLSADTVRFTALEGGAAPGTQTVTVYAMGVFSKYGGTSLDDIDAVDDAAWLSTALTGEGDERSLTCTADPAGLAPGPYTAAVTVTADGAEAVIEVEFTVFAIVQLAADTDTLRLASYPGGPAPAPGSVRIHSDQGQSLAGLQVADNAAWLTVQAAVDGDTAVLSNSIDMAAVPEGVNTATVTVTLGDSSTAYTVQMTSIHYDIARGLQGYWPFNEGGGSTAGDSSGNGHDGALTDVTWEPGHTGYAVRADVDSQGYVNTGIWDPSDGDLTVMCWVYWDGSNGAHQAMISKCSSSSDTKMKWIYTRSKLGYVALGSYWARTGGAFFVDLRSGVWLHTAAVKKDSVTTLYFDADSVGTSVLDYSLGDTAPIWLCNGYNGVAPFNGLIDDVRIYDRALSREEIHYIYAGVTDTATTVIRSDMPAEMVRAFRPSANPVCAGTELAVTGAFRPGDRFTLYTAGGNKLASCVISSYCTSVGVGKAMVPGILVIRYDTAGRTVTQRVLVVE